MNPEELKEWRERCAALAALSLYNHSTQSVGWKLKRPTTGTYEFDVFDDSGQRVSAIEVKSIVPPELNKESSLSKVIARVAELTKGKLQGTMQLLNAELTQDLMGNNNSREALAQSISEEVERLSRVLRVHEGDWLTIPLHCVVYKTSDDGSHLSPAYGFTNSGGLTEEHYRGVVQAGVSKANSQLSAALGVPHLFVVDSRTPMTQALGGPNLIVEAVKGLSPSQYSDINTVFLVEWPSNTRDQMAGLVVHGFPL